MTQMSQRHCDSNSGMEKREAYISSHLLSMSLLRTCLILRMVVWLSSLGRR
uniref:Alternative protein AIFM1 n=1 Tax=Homo sapiens TaxID=9606 RepID=L8E8P8_HUMAN|nr:alternative protein AIFM1 [Homo sapiens]